MINTKSKLLRMTMLLACLSALLLIIVTSSAITANNAGPLKVGIVTVGPKSDYGWNYAQELGKEELDKVLKGKVSTTFVESVPENAEAERVMERLIAQGNKLIFAASYGYLEPTSRVAAHHPDVKFMQLSRVAKLPNVGFYVYRQYEAMYVAGVVAGRMTKVNKLGFVAAHPVPPLLQTINAFVLGVRSVNPKAKIKVVWTNAWVDPTMEVEAAKGLMDSGIDVLAFDQSAPLAIVKTAESSHVYVVGCYTDDHQFAPKYWLTGAALNWAPFYTKIAKSVLDGTWKAGVNICDMSNDSVNLSTFGPAVPPAVRKEATTIANKIKNREVIVFQGPVKDSTGKERLAAGKKPDIEWLTTMNFFVPGIEGSLPKK